jgi:hypothetical protein
MGGIESEVVGEIGWASLECRKSPKCCGLVLGSWYDLAGQGVRKLLPSGGTCFTFYLYPMRVRHIFPLFGIVAVVAVVALVGFARPANASVNLGLGADWIEGGQGEFNLTLGADTFLARRLSVGGRAGVAFFDDSHHIGIPIDFRLKLHVERIYFEGLVGPWALIDSGDLFRFHGAFGFGLESGGLAFGLEVGRLGQSTLLGLRLAFRL